MIFFYNASGTLIKVAPDHVYQGSDGATTLYFVAPIVSTAVGNVAFTLPNGERTAKHILTPVTGELDGITDGDGNTYKVWAYDLDGHITAYAGNVAAQFFITISGVLRSTQAANFTVELGVPPVIEPPEGDSYDEIMAYIQEVWAQLQANIDKKQNIIDGDNMLPSDYVTDENQTHKFVSAEEKAEWNGKQDALTETQLNAVNSGIDSAKVAKIGTNESAINNINGKIPSSASSSNKLVDAAQMAAFAMPIMTKYGANLSLAFNSANGVLTAQLKDQDGNNLGTAQTVTIDLTSLENTINNILALIPAQASAQNQLTDKNFVNSSISTNTAHFIGTFNSLAELEAYTGTVTNNDYANVIRTEDGQTYYDRYTYNGNTEVWEFNFTVNTTSFTAAQWAALNSGITASKVAEIDQKVDKSQTIAGIDLRDNITKSELLTALNVEDGAQKNTVTSVSNKTGAVSLDKSDVGLSAVDNVRQYSSDNPNFSTDNPQMDGTASTGSATTYAHSDHIHPSDTSKQNALTFDSTPTAGSTNPVTSEGIKTAIDNAITNVYRFEGSSSVVLLNLMLKLPYLNGYVYDISSGGTLNNYSGTIDVNTGDNVAFVWNNGDWRWDKLAGTIDLSNYYTKSQTDTELAKKADKVTGATNGDFAALDSNGNLTDSGVKPNDFYNKQQTDNLLLDKQNKLTQSTDLTPTTQTLTLTANTRYALGTLTALNITFPASANDGDTIIIEFVSGSTATTLTRDTTNAIYNFDSVSANVFVELNAEYKVSINKWVVYSAETTYGV